MKHWLVSIHDVPGEGLPVSGNVEVDPSAFDGRAVSGVDDVTIESRIMSISGCFTLRGEIHTTVSLACSRCLDGMSNTLTIPVMARLVPEQDDDPGTFSYEEERVDVTAIVEEMIQLAVPMKPLCSDTCRGLCTRCGENLNRDQCSCKEPAPDPRWEILQTITKEV